MSELKKETLKHIFQKNIMALKLYVLNNIYQIEKENNLFSEAFVKQELGFDSYSFESKSKVLNRYLNNGRIALEDVVVEINYDGIKLKNVVRGYVNKIKFQNGNDGEKLIGYDDRAVCLLNNGVTVDGDGENNVEGFYFNSNFYLSFLMDEVGIEMLASETLTKNACVSPNKGSIISTKSFLMYNWIQIFLWMLNYRFLRRFEVVNTLVGFNEILINIIEEVEIETNENPPLTGISDTNIVAELLEKLKKKSFESFQIYCGHTLNISWNEFKNLIEGLEI